MNYKIEVNHGDKDNERLRKQCEELDKLVKEGQFALICLGEYNEEDGGLRCKATTVVHTDKTSGNLALAASLFENMMKNDVLCTVIMAAAHLYYEHDNYVAEQN